jgi:lipoate synthase
MIAGNRCTRRCGLRAVDTGRLVEYVPPAAFDEYATIERAVGFRRVAAGPLVRSPHHAERAFTAAEGRATSFLEA